MFFYADIHVHSKYSRATSKDCDLKNLSLWARKKGIKVIGTGDFTHPAWLSEIEEQLISAEPGLFKLRPEIEKIIGEQLGKVDSIPTRFMLSVEISTIYKKKDRTRKVHHVICVPELKQAHYLVERLSHIGNLRSDGRPILGLDSRDLLEITLEAGQGAFLIPAHIWTPWFSMLGSKSGFDSVQECYEDLSSHIFALETGLSSDPAMNRRLSSLDDYRLVSNSDAHSPSKLGREANVFSCAVDYYAMMKSLQTGKDYWGTVEFFPEEGKYHLDGHRSCNIRFDPAETRQHKGICPECKKPVTVGVMHRVEELADRPKGAKNKEQLFKSLVPLTEVLSEIEGVGVNSKRVASLYEGLLNKIGPELFILQDAPIEDLKRYGCELLAQGIDRMRRGNVICDAGYDGEYGVIRLFEPDELEKKQSVGLLQNLPQK